MWTINDVYSFLAIVIPFKIVTVWTIKDIYTRFILNRYGGLHYGMEGLHIKTHKQFTDKHWVVNVDGLFSFLLDDVGPDLCIFKISTCNCD